MTGGAGAGRRLAAADAVLGGGAGDAGQFEVHRDHLQRVARAVVPDELDLLADRDGDALAPVVTFTRRKTGSAVGKAAP
jgi:hypothetical protein